ncbi:helicase-exonuclease AddAB%2C AddB subunit [Streptococcus pneumoniae]|nr:helicase-exonuclease AddAB%2C AddB subunit [Streptococcus pneumoniae]
MMRLLKTNVLTDQFKNSTHLIDLLENFAIERGIYGKRWLDDELFNIENFRKMGRKEHQLTQEEKIMMVIMNKLKKLIKFGTD